MTSPTPGELWQQAGGGTPNYSRDRYRELLREHGLLVPLASGEKPQPLPCGWPGRPTTQDDADLSDDARRTVQADCEDPWHYQPSTAEPTDPCPSCGYEEEVYR